MSGPVLAGYRRGATAFGRLRPRVQGWIAFGTVLVVTLIVHRVGDPHRLLPDEVPSAKVWRAVAAGVDPYDPSRSGYPNHPYFPTFLYGGGLLVRGLGETPVILLQRLLNVLSISVVIWLCTGAFVRRALPRAALGAALVLFKPFAWSIDYGNLSPFAAATTLAPLLLWPRWPVLAGVMLSLGLATKPSGLAALPLLLVHRPATATRRHLVAGLVASALLAALVLATARNGAFLRQERGWAPHESATSASVQRVLQKLGAEVPAGVVFAGVVAVGALLSRRRPLTPTELALLGAAVSLASLSRVWHHSFAVGILAVAGSLVRAGRDLRRPAAARAPAVLRALAVLIGVLILSSSNAWSDDWEGVPDPILAVSTSLPLLSLVGLSLYAAGASRKDREEPSVPVSRDELSPGGARPAPD